MKLARPVLLVDDEAQWLRSLSISLRRMVPEAQIDTCVDGREVMDRMATRGYDLVLLDLTMPHVSGEELLQQIRAKYPNTRVIIVTGVNQIDAAVRCMRNGAYDYFNKACEVTELVASVRRALEVVGLELSLSQLRQHFFSKQLQQPEALNDLVTCEPKMLDRLRYLEAISVSPAPVLIEGPLGSGKQTFAKALHRLSQADTPFHSVNLSGQSNEQIQLSLFGRVPNGTEPAQPGIVQQAQNGLLYLSHVDELSMELQGQLLTLLEQGQFYPLGSDRPRVASCRIAVSSQQDLKQLVSDGRFRQDLLYRLNGHRLVLPPLSERPLDIALLINHFIDMAAKDLQREAPLLPNGLADKLKHYEFPGNLTELKGMVYDAVSRSDEQTLCQSPFLMAITEQGSEPTAVQIRFGDELPSLAQANRALVMEAMSRCANNQSAAAKLLGISQSALSRRLAKEGLL
ncbi:sigma-54-dependent transcriptional regulator [Paraferrimonas sedimenticola]|uniref:Sigma-54-dependent Fis family transcriptional regulator n=1 Tax=Paraferrimonas sedimenticola TaxID=375674 RepID=A0AA37VSW7_9GAMM|nr:sigma-54 dependent transcriptional regulator [Paraferrimonas sedimenticola]GLP95021.1 sigma-54-dependent Fis family transcriptional regulator [Paraferrimonas sedimenticola]